MAFAALPQRGTGLVPMRSLNKLAFLRKHITGLRRLWLVRSTGAYIDPSVSISLSARLVGGAPGAIRIGEKTLIAFKTLLLARTPGGVTKPITIGRNCFIGGGTLIVPGISIGDGCVIAAGSVVLNDIPARSVAGGNPARVLRADVEVLPYGRFPTASENQGVYWGEVKTSKRPRKCVVAIAALFGISLMLSILDELPRWRLMGTLPVRVHALPDVGTFPFMISSEASLTFMGDSNTSGSRVGGSQHAFPFLLQTQLRNQGKLVNLASGGATVLNAVRPVGGASDFVFVMLGTNDAPTRGRIGFRTSVDQSSYRQGLSRIVAELVKGHAKVVILAPPPVGSAAMARRLEPYRIEARNVAIEQGVSFIDSAGAFVDGTIPPLSHDALHLNAAGQLLLAQYLATRIVVK